LWEIVIPGKPVPKQSFKFRVIIPKYATDPSEIRKHVHVSAYQPSKVDNFQIYVRGIVREFWKRRRPIDEPVAVAILFHFERPKTPKFKRWPATKPDLDNLEKPIIDGLEKGGMLKNDSRVCLVQKMKLFSYEARTVVRVTTMEAYRGETGNFAGYDEPGS
jgi:Holliday junction resolvase RusA-like endonuclease